MKPETEDPDLLLLDRIVARDPLAFEQFYRKHHAYLLDYLLRMLHDRETAEEVLQNLMLAIWNGAVRFRRLSLVRTWMIAIARRQALKTMPRFSDLALDEETFAAEDDLTAIRVDQAQVERLQAAITRLPAYEREVLELVYYREMTLAKAAMHLGISVNTVKSRLYRARAKLRKWMAEADEAQDF
ncbi:MAG: RNA polymerase sigma factor [Chloroflexota bacterium]